jgi:glycolate oxidase
MGGHASEAPPLAREAYRALEDIVGPEHISDDPLILDGYSFFFLSELITALGAGGERKFIPRPAAVLLPGSVEEVQRIVRVCNRRGLQFHAFSTGVVCEGGAGRIQLDLRRMDRILEIDARNRIAVIEPYVTNARLFHATIRKGLRAHVHAAGANTSPLASATSVGGEGPDNPSCGYSSRNVLGVEWVLPSGELLKLGALGSGAGWFSGDGPGPSLRGLMRGVFGAFGGLGVFTKVAVKLYPWHGPPEFQGRGLPPSYDGELPAAMKACFAGFPTADQMYDAVNLVWEEGIAHTFNRMPRSFLCYASSDSNQKAWELWQSGLLDEEFTNGISLLLAGFSKDELAYKERVLAEILRRTGGRIARSLQDDPRFPLGLLRTSILSDGVFRAVSRPSGAILEGYYLNESVDVSRLSHDASYAHTRSFTDRGICIDNGETNWGTFSDIGYLSEQIPHFDPRDEKSVQGMLELLATSYQKQFESRSGAGLFANIGALMNDAFGPMLSNVHVWKKRIKRALDPRTACDPTGYSFPEESP